MIEISYIAVVDFFIISSTLNHRWHTTYGGTNSTIVPIIHIIRINNLSKFMVWAMIGALAMSLVPAHHIGLATSIVFGGVSAASVFGVPILSVISSRQYSLINT